MCALEIQDGHRCRTHNIGPYGDIFFLSYLKLLNHMTTNFSVLNDHCMVIYQMYVFLCSLEKFKLAYNTVHCSNIRIWINSFSQKLQTCLNPN